MSSHHSGAYICESCDKDFSSKEVEAYRKKEHSSSGPSNIQLTD